MGGSGREVWDGKASGEGGVKCGVGEEGGGRKRERGGEGEGRARLDRRERKKKTGMKKRGGG